jgi:hypothetical protein
VRILLQEVEEIKMLLTEHQVHIQAMEVL